MKICCIILSLFCVSLNFGCSIFYVAKQGVYQVKLLAGAEPIKHALRSPKLSANERAKLMLITRVREYSQKKLKLVADKNYQDVNLSWDKIIYNVSASAPLEFKPHTWWFPIIGSVPYKGYFDEKDADKEILRLKKLGLDTLKRRVGGYSTLGYFSDPVWPTMLEMRDEALVELIIHELAHSSVYIPNQTAFNETFANFIGKIGTRMFYVDSFGEKSQEVNKLDEFNLYEKEYNKFFSKLYNNLDNLYAKDMSVHDKKMAQQKILQEAQINYTNIFPDKNISNNWLRVNNAYLLAFKTYNHDEAVFADLYNLVDHDIGKFLEQVASHSHGKNAFKALREHINKQRNKIAKRDT